MGSSLLLALLRLQKQIILEIQTYGIAVMMRGALAMPFGFTRGHRRLDGTVE